VRDGRKFDEAESANVVTCHEMFGCK
jgi:hypothetical protein